MTRKQKEKSEQWFRRLLRLFPFDFRWEHGHEMEQDFRGYKKKQAPSGESACLTGFCQKVFP